MKNNKQVVVATSKGRILRAVLEGLSENEISKKVLAFTLYQDEIVVAMQIIDI